MHALTALTAVVAVASASVLPRNAVVPSSDGLTNPTAQQLLAIEQSADGRQPNGQPPPGLAPSSKTGFKLVLANELMECAFFSQLIYNITNNVPGYAPEPAKKDELLDILNTVLSQEELHALNAQNTLEHFEVPVIPSPCQYLFPVTNLLDALALASKITEVVLGTLQDFNNLLATNGDTGPVRTVTSIVGQEGQQDGWYRILLARKPSAQPYLTTSLAPFAWSAIQGLTVPNSCHYSLSEVELPIFPALNVLSCEGGAKVSATDQTLKFSAVLSDSDVNLYRGSNGQGLYVTYLSGQQTPIVEPITILGWSGNQVTFEALFPGKSQLMFGLSIAALTHSNTFASVDDIPDSTLAAPGLIEVIDQVNAWDKDWT